MSDDHVHDCTGPGGRCPCGYTFTVPRYSVSFEVYDGESDSNIAADCFSSDSLVPITSALQRLVDKLETLT